MLKQTSIELYDSTLRDGGQAPDVLFDVKDKLAIIKDLLEFGIDCVEVGWLGANPTDTEVFSRLKRGSVKGKCAAFSSVCSVKKSPQTDENFQHSVSADVGTMTLFAPFSLKHIRGVLGVEPGQMMEVMARSIEYCQTRFDRVLLDAEHFFDGFRNDPLLVSQIIACAQNTGIDTLVLCDTNGGASPAQVGDTIKMIRSTFPKLTIGFHGHNDRECGVANSLVAVEHGATHIQGTINGIGERVGNANLTSIIPNLIASGRVLNRIDVEGLKGLRALSNKIESRSGVKVKPSSPWVGDGAYTHKAGVHASAILKNPQYYEHMPPEMVGNRRKLVLSSQSGLAAVRYYLEQQGYSNTIKFARSVLAEIKQQSHHGILVEKADATLELLVHRCYAQYSKTPAMIEVDNLSVKQLNEVFTVSLTLKINGKRRSIARQQANVAQATSSCMTSLLAGASELAMDVTGISTIHEGYRALVTAQIESRSVCACAVAKSEAHAIAEAVVDLHFWRYLAEVRSVDKVVNE